MKKLVVGILAHVDAGKTTLSESMLYLSGKIVKLGRVDNKDAYLDTFELERARGITIFSKQAIFEIEETEITLLDTPGHVDFSAEMERTLQVLDYGILVISGADGVQGHTKTLWKLLDKYKIPVFLFVNKMDQNGTDIDKLIRELKKQLDDGCIEFGQVNEDSFYDQLAMCDEIMMEDYLKTGHIESAHIKDSIMRRKIFPCFFGSALKLDGINEFMKGIVEYTSIPHYPNLFGAKIFKITRDEQGNRLTHMKLTGGILKVKDVLTNGIWEEKINQIRVYSGQKFQVLNEIDAGSVFAVTGLKYTKPGEVLGIENSSDSPVLEPVLSYRVILEDGCDPRTLIPKLRQIEEEEPELHIIWEEKLQEIQVRIMGEVQIEILQSLIQSRFGVNVAFDAGRIVYKETIANVVEGVGHFEPLRHYAEVHLLMEPGEPGSGLQFGLECSEDILSKSWQRLILTHLQEKTHIGVLTGSAITDMKITLVSGKAHNKHTEGGDFREATYRAVRQGLKESQSILLEPFYEFQLELPEKMVGRAMNDIEKMYGKCEVTQSNGETAILVGSGPVITMRNYQKEVVAYTKGLGRLFYTLKGYEPCHNPEDVMEKIGYDSERDVCNPTGSVFCANGVGFSVEWDNVKDYMHVESYFEKKYDLQVDETPKYASSNKEQWISLEEVDKIINNTSHANQGKKTTWKRIKNISDYYSKPSNVQNGGGQVKLSYTSDGRAVILKNSNLKKSSSSLEISKEEYLLVDGYNIIFAWSELKSLADDNMESARMKLLDTLCDYQGIRKCQIIVVFDAYRVHGHVEEITDYSNIRMVFTREAQTADNYIEKFAHDNQKKYNITVATSDGLQQIIIRGAGCSLLSSSELKQEIDRAKEIIMQEYKHMQGLNRNYLIDSLSQEAKQKMKERSSSKID